ncbi:MAG: S41 family peptidase [Saprospiraceae bacterium]
MKTKLLFSLYILFFVQTFHAQVGDQSLTRKEKIEDFEFLHTELKASYPYFEVNKRKHQIDWLANEKSYCKKIKATKNDIEFYLALSNILNDLNNGHTDMLPTFYYEYFVQGYEQAVPHSPEYQPYLEELKKYDAPKKYKHWIKIKNDLAAAKDTTEDHDSSSETSKTPANAEFELDAKNSIAILKIHSFSYDFIERDSPQIADFFKEITLYKNLIIDIQGNTGGDDYYWQSNIVGHLISKKITFPVITAFKTSARIARMKPDYQPEFGYKKINLPNLPEELKTGDYQFMDWENSIVPNQNGKDFEGKIYLLVDDEVYSSAETLAYFCKATQFATTAGIQTNGDGIGSDPLLITLPNSGIVIRFTGEMALNPDGSSNEEMRTIPDLILNGKTKKERLQLLKKEIINK